jgi:hypothetical protein
MNNKVEANENKLKAEKIMSYPVTKNCPIFHQLSAIFKPAIRQEAVTTSDTAAIEILKTVVEFENGTFSVESDECINNTDLDVFLAISAIARDTNRRLTAQSDDLLTPFSSIPSKKGAGKNLINPKDESSHVEDAMPATIEIDARELASESIGVGGNQLKMVNEAIRRLANVRVRFDGKRWEGVFNLLSYFYCKESQIYTIAINPIFSYTICSDTATYKLVDRRERSRLSQTAKSLHHYLCGIVFQGETRRNLSINDIVKKIIISPKTLVTLEDVQLKKVSKKRHLDCRSDEELEELKNVQSRVRNAEKDFRTARSRVVSALVSEINYLDDWSVSVTGRGATLKLDVTRSSARKAVEKRS